MKKDAFFRSGFFLLLGIVIGFLVSPVKKGLGNNSGNNYRFCCPKSDKEIQGK